MTANESSLSLTSQNNRVKSAGLCLLGEDEIEKDEEHSKVFLLEAKLECTLNTLASAFGEISEQKQSIASLVSNYGEQYCLQLQKFSVLAYDYLERIDHVFKREQ